MAESAFVECNSGNCAESLLRSVGKEKCGYSIEVTPQEISSQMFTIHGLFFGGGVRGLAAARKRRRWQQNLLQFLDDETTMCVWLSFVFVFRKCADSGMANGIDDGKMKQTRPKIITQEKWSRNLPIAYVNTPVCYDTTHKSCRHQSCTRTSS